jgi:Fe-S oxidoreductase
MPLYRVVGTVTASKYLGEFEADSPEEAVEKALESEEAHVSVCHQCAHDVSDPGIEEAFAELVEDQPAKKRKK